MHKAHLMASHFLESNPEKLWDGGEEEVCNSYVTWCMAHCNYSSVT